MWSIVNIKTFIYIKFIFDIISVYLFSILHFESGKYLVARWSVFCQFWPVVGLLCYRPVHPIFFDTACTLLLWSPLQEHSARGRHCVSRGLVGLEVWSLGACHSKPACLRGEGAGRASTTQLVPGSLTLWLLAWSEQPGVGVDLPCVWGLSVSALLSLTCLSCVMSTADWESRGERKSEVESQRDCVCACVSVSDCWLLEYKWDVLIHLNQGHMLGPRVKCSERNEALYCICHSAQEIKPGTSPALHEILWRVTFKESVVINWLHDWPDCKRFCYFHVHYIFYLKWKNWSNLASFTLSHVSFTIYLGYFLFIALLLCKLVSK